MKLKCLIGIHSFTLEPTKFINLKSYGKLKSAVEFKCANCGKYKTLHYDENKKLYKTVIHNHWSIDHNNKSKF